MKKFLYSVTLIMITSFAFAQKQKMPFIGTKNFSFTMGNCCEQSISISKNGNCIIRGGASTNNKILYNGKYSNLIWLYDTKKRKIGGFRIDGKTITSLDKNGGIEKECGMDANEFCVTEFY
ncbi:hypothetical protein [Chryseobacterium sp. 5_R23647]|uniref:hypothetical protein n=1 Tax=Chryseobacterium sp. 5_R23647 TaxID=2258964 RepID=UPI000E2718C0|nr:hypothetical protein [Chryseobacterium sp. 5_R23647]REC40202.1 hypothetical protein DRF69_19700 [Chryseobacterium sp. 5_R23647]REC40206.1 hypothetical protein DRF69_19720 [Chryseobacterium sp. 5_R23647]